MTAEKKAMAKAVDAVSISLASIVLDLPDRTGRCIAKDLAAGWAYRIADRDGDERFRGQGSCAGGLKVGLRYAFLAAIACVPESRRLTVCVDQPQLHRQMARLATEDAQVAAAIAGRPLSIMTRPDQRSAHQARAAAERAAMTALQAREAAEREVQSAVLCDPGLEDAATPELAPPAVAIGDGSWRSRWGANAAVARTTGEAAEDVVRRAIATEALGQASAPPEAEWAGCSPPFVGAAMTQWVQEFSGHVERVKKELLGIGR